jgi:uncharacterized RDD family membrane protein YckC
MEKPVKMCPSYKAFQDAVIEECPNCNYDLTNVDTVNQKVTNDTFLHQEEMYPTILRRYFATATDGLLVLIFIVTFPYVIQGEGRLLTVIRILFLIILLIYEPFCTSKLCTVGQKIMGVRIRDLKKIKKISIVRAYVRILIKLFLGIISFITIPITKGRRGIHDFAAGTIVLTAKAADAPLFIKSQLIQQEDREVDKKEDNKEKELYKEENIILELEALAGMQMGNDEYEAAERLYKKALERGEKSLGLENPYVLNILENLAKCLREMGRKDEAEVLESQAKPI